jgi:hypothetical protein
VRFRTNQPTPGTSGALVGRGGCAVWPERRTGAGSNGLVEAVSLSGDRLLLFGSVCSCTAAGLNLESIFLLRLLK